jgi:hypothetical protein
VNSGHGVVAAFDADQALVVVVALVGLVGVIVGGVLNGVVTAALERIQSARRAMVASRLIQDDLNYINAVLRTELEQGVWNRLTANAPPVPFESWRDGRDGLAGHLSFGEWGAVSIAARQALFVVQRGPMNPKAGHQINANERAVMESMLPDLQHGIQVLLPLSYGRRVPSFWSALLRDPASRLQPPE